MLVEELKVPNPKYLEAQSAGRSLWGLDQYITNFSVMPDGSLLVPRGVRSWIVDQAAALGVGFTTTDKRKSFDHIEIDSSKIIYRPYQAKAITTMITKSSEGLLVAPAGSGKTVMGLSIIPIVGQPTLWLTHTGPLADQAIERAQSFLPNIGDIGMIGRGKWERGEVLTVAMVQTLVRNPKKLVQMRDDYGLVILDEAHHCPARTFLDVVSQLNSFYMYGLTATPYRRDNLEMLMFQYLGLESTVITMDEVEKHGGIVVPIVKARKVPGPVVDGNNLQQIIKHNIVNNAHRNSMILSDVLTEARQGKYCIVISDRRAHCELLYKMISRGWKKTGIVTGKYTKKQIQEQVEKFNAEDITVLVATFSLLGEGFDVPFLDRAFITMPFRAEAKAEQLIGRIQRSFPGKEDAIVYDYVDENIGVIKNQFFNQRRACRYRTYMRLGVKVESD
jgi:superfamily II DNA or RNA helicase